MRDDDGFGLTDNQLLRRRICDLPGIRAAASPRLRRYVDGLHEELELVGFKHFRPEVYLGDEWFSPDGVPKIAIPFYLAHPRLISLEQRMMSRVEGGRPAELKKLLRHEAGHCFDHAFDISKSRAWRQVFGASSQRYNPDVYIPDPESRDFVHHLPGFYAQSHPDEDFAETFATVITPKLDWRRRYRNWPGALAKLEFVAGLVRKHGPRHPSTPDGPDCYNAVRMRMTLARYYERRRRSAAAHRAAVKKLAHRSGLSTPPKVH